MTDDITNWTKSDDGRVEDAIRRGASRRDLLKLMLASGVALSAGAAVFGRAERAVAATPVSGGHLKVGGISASNADTLDPAKASLGTDYARCCALYNRLTFINASGVPQMELAEKLDTKDAKTWTATLRKGVTFHNGKALTSADVVFALKRHLDPAVGSKVAKIAAQITEVKAIDPSTVEIVLTAANADLPYILALHHFMIVQDGTTDFSKGVGTGAFVLETFEPGVRSIMKKNKNYWKPNLPHIDSFEFFAIGDQSARVNALLAGDIQVASAVNPRSAKLVKAQSGFELIRSTTGNYTNMNIRVDKYNSDFVTGMKYLVDREQIIAAALRGDGVVGNDQPISPVNNYCNKDLKPKAFDPDKAKFHLKKADVMGQSIPVIASEAADASIDIAMIVQASAADVGLKLDVQRVPSDGYWDKYWLKAPIHFGNINPRPTPDIYFSLLYSSDAPWNESQYKSEKFDKMMLEARGLLDEAKRHDIYNEMQTMISEEAGTIIPAYSINSDGISTKVKGLETNPLGGMMGYALAEYVWLEA
ncbi:ABC transporter substrate-binding protein [Oryzifoliimicrobium ureilyticus]|uniref:ABC transporter substrate-binding protein n=1 Tax=Oryzifoliimicrobium ureilyticus TaxID=3113724 RepID=UPI0030762FFF